MRTAFKALGVSLIILVSSFPVSGTAFAVTATVTDTLTSTIGSPMRLFQEKHRNAVAQEFKGLLQNTTDPLKRDALKANQRAKSMELEHTYMEFMGSSEYDNSLLSGEFLHNRGDSMMKKRNLEGETFFFFNQARLWKVLQTLPSNTNVEELARLLSARFGQGVTLTDAKGVKGTVWQTGDRMIELSDRRNEYGCFTLTHAEATMSEARSSMNEQKGNVAKVDPMIQAILSGGNDDSISNVVDGILDEPSAGTH